MSDALFRVNIWSLSSNKQCLLNTRCRHDVTFWNPSATETYTILLKCFLESPPKLRQKRGLTFGQETLCLLEDLAESLDELRAVKPGSQSWLSLATKRLSSGESPLCPLHQLTRVSIGYHPSLPKIQLKINPFHPVQLKHRLNYIQRQRCQVLKIF